MKFFVFFFTLFCMVIPDTSYTQDIQLTIKSTPVQDSLYLEQSFDVAILNAQTPLHYVWDFGDNHVSFDSNPVHAYASPGKYRVWLNIMDADGLTANAIHWVQVHHDIFQKDQQNIYRYLSATQINCIFWDQFKDNTAWIGTQGGLIRVDLKNDVQQYYRNPLPSGTVQDIVQMYDQSIWIATTGGLVQFNDLTLEWRTMNALNSELTENNVYALATSNNQEKLWIGTMGGGIFCMDMVEKTWVEFSTHNTEMPTANIWDLTIDNQDNLWAATHRGLIFLNPTTHQLKIFNQENSDLPDNIINVVDHDSHHQIWMGTWSQGLVKYDPENEHWKMYTINNSPLSNNFIDHLTSTPDGHIWVATKKNGLLCLDPEIDSWQKFSTICKAQSNQHFFNVLSTDENHVIVHVNHALVKMDDNGNCQYHTRLCHRHLPENSISCLTQSKNNDIWIGLRYKGLMQLFPSTHEWNQWDPLNSSLKSYDIRCIHEMGGGKIAAGTANGLSLYDINARQWTTFHSLNSDLPHNTIMCLFYDANAYLWIGTMNGIARFYPSTFEWKTFQAITDTITCLAQTSDGRIWAGTTTNGFLEYQQSEDQWIRYNQSNSDLPDNHIQSMISGQNRKLWIGTASQGLCAMGLDTKKFDHFHVNNSSLKNNSINALAESQSGVIWVGTDDPHLCRFHPLTHEWQTVALSENASDISSIMDIAIESEDNLWIATKENGIIHASWPQSLQSPGSVIIIENSQSRYSNPYDHYQLIQHIYQTFIQQNYRHDDIWLMTMTQEIDINGDYCADSVIDSPPDQNRIVETITQWAKERYVQNQPLFVFLLGNWFQNTSDNEPSYILPSLPYLKASQLHDAISLYEKETGGQVILLIDGIVSNDRIPDLSTKGRVVILSDLTPTSRENVYTSFIPNFISQLSSGHSVYQAFMESKKQTSQWRYHQANPFLDDNGDRVFNDLDGSFARQMKWDSHLDIVEDVIQNVQVTSNHADGLSLTILCQLPIAQIQAQLISLSGDNTPISVIPLEHCFFNSYCGAIQNVSPSSSYELVVMAKDYHGHMFVSDPEILQVGNLNSGSIWGKIDIKIDTHKISFKDTNSRAVLVNTEWYGIIHSDGTFSLDQIPAGSYTMRVDGPGFSAPILEPIQVSAGMIHQLTPTTIDISKSWCSIDSDCNGQFDLKDVIYLLQVMANNN